MDKFKVLEFTLCLSTSCGGQMTAVTDADKQTMFTITFSSAEELRDFEKKFATNPWGIQGNPCECHDATGESVFDFWLD